ncbi:hypothetical protein NDU88_008864 [Pleurodeles waltl]|uniref:Reverse transcriptase domain-containing protein n=1 Tax=Pleurodeles waltl TaxID=8319 RepID=A0AAV7RYX4_PLEWA|nr:hypothetical protein NDU88_008864 [Pleurodeles waltl]
METLTFNNTSVQEEIHTLRGDIPAQCLLSNVTSQLMGHLAMMYHMSEHHSILKEYPALFKGLVKLKDIQVTLDVNKAINPVAQNQRRVPIHLQPEVDKELKSLLQQDIIEPAEGPAPCVSSIVAMLKKNTNKIHICVNMHLPNTAIEREGHPGPHRNNMISCLTGACMFSKLDLFKGYNSWNLTVSHATSPHSPFTWVSSLQMPRLWLINRS